MVFRSGSEPGFAGNHGQAMDDKDPTKGAEHDAHMTAADGAPPASGEPSRRRLLLGGSAVAACAIVSVRPALAQLRTSGLRLVIAGNQPPRALTALRAMDLPVDEIRNSAELGVEKPEPEFFVAAAELAGMPPQNIAYVGDRIDNDVLPAADAGMRPILIRRGPWGYLHARRPEAARATVIDSLLELPGLLAGTAVR